MGVIKYFFSCIILYPLAFAQSDQDARVLLRDFDLSYYRPQVYALRDFKVDIRINGLAEKLAQQLVFGSLKDVFFEMSWLRRDHADRPDYKKIEVKGLPNGFFEVKSQLASNILQRADFIVPISLSERMRDYKLEMTADKNGGRTIICRDPTNLKDANEIILVFDPKKRLKRFVVKRPIGLETVDLELVKKPWGQGKWVLNQYNVEKIHGVQTIKSKSTFDYKVVGGFGLPERIKTVTTQTLRQPATKKSGTYEREITSRMKFSNWRINADAKNSDFRN